MMHGVLFTSISCHRVNQLTSMCTKRYCNICFYQCEVELERKFSSYSIASSFVILLQLKLSKFKLEIKSDFQCKEERYEHR